MLLNNSEGWKEDGYCLGLLIIRFLKKKRLDLPSSNRISKFRFWMSKKITFEIKVRFELKKIDSNLFENKVFQIYLSWPFS